MKTLVTVLLLCLLAMTIPVAAQDSIPVEELAVLPIRGAAQLAFSSDGERLLIADGNAGSIRLFDITSDLTDIDRLAAFDLYGNPTAIAATTAFGIAAVDTGEDSDFVQVLELTGRGDTTVNLIDTPDNPFRIITSAGDRWAMALAEDGFTLMEIISAYNINFYTFDTPENAVIDAVIAQRMAMLVREGRSQVDILALTEEAPPEAGASVEFDANVLAIALTTDTATGAVALDDGRIVFFTPRNAAILNEVVYDTDDIRDMEFLEGANGVWLIVSRSNEDTIAILDLTDMDDITDLGGVIELESPVRGMAARNNIIAVSDGSIVTLIQIGE